MKNIQNHYNGPIIIFFFLTLTCLRLFASTNILDSSPYNINGQDKIKYADTIVKYFKNIESVKTRSAKPEVLDDSDPLRLDVPFNFDSAELTPEAKKQLDELGKALRSGDLVGISILLIGHTDERGSVIYNKRLSQRRVESAKQYLAAVYHLNRELIKCIGYGESKPIIVNAQTEAEHALNRRVEIQPANSNVAENMLLEKVDQQIGGNNLEVFKEYELNPGNLRLEWGVFHEGKNQKDELIRHNGGSVLITNEAYRIYVKPRKKSYVYLYQVDSKGKGIWLFPRKDIEEKNPLSPDDHWLPSRNKRFTLDSTTGTETIYLIASNEPATDIESIINGDDIVMTSDVVTKTIKTRGVGQIKIGPPPGAGEEKSISIIDKSSTLKKGLTVSSIQPKNVVHVISNSGDFYTYISFKHE